ncbi:MAG: inositol phosphorylceramide synthase [Candidatus Daviesbacteria bacterium]|nr:MAG: inositol phosphorylceramide synthase [Candidatus Daviesbacteria bacterium]
MLYLVIFILYIIAMTGVMIWQGIGIAPDRYAMILLVGSLLIKRTRQFLMDWIPFLFILIAYDFLRGFSDNLNLRVHINELISWEKTIFGAVPTQALQEKFFQLGSLQWYDYLATVFYFLHFALPLAFGYLLWLKSRVKFRQFILALLLMSYAAWISFLVYPAAPPWYAHDQGYLPQITKILDQTLAAFPEKIALPTVYHQLNPNQVAAIPSMHAGYPTLVFLFSLSFFGLRALIFLPYMVAVFLSTVYLGEHYVIDLLFGMVYALGFFFLGKLVLFKKIKYFKAT